VNIVGALIPANGPSVQESGQPIVQLYPEETSSQLPVLTPFLQRDLLHAAWERSIPVFQVRQIADRVILDTLRLLRPDVACVSCFPNRIPGRLLSFPRFGFLNLHPSLLPDYRGPAPLFWIFRNGDQGSMGITVQRRHPLARVHKPCRWDIGLGGRQAVRGTGRLATFESPRFPGVRRPSAKTTGSKRQLLQLSFDR
jgi:hypothetical protein